MSWLVGRRSSRGIFGTVRAVAPLLMAGVLTISLALEARAEMRGGGHRPGGGHGTSMGGLGAGLAIGIIGGALLSSRDRPDVTEQKAPRAAAKSPQTPV